MDPKVTGEKEEGASPASDTQVQQQEPAAQPAPAPAAAPTPDGGVTPGGKTYTEAEVQSIMHARTKDYAEMRRQLDAYRQHGSVDEIATKLKPSQAQAASQEQAGQQLDDDEKKFVAYLKKVLPELRSLDSLKGLDADKINFLNQMREREIAAEQAYVGSAEQAIMSHCDSVGLKTDAQKSMMREVVAATIISTPELHNRFTAKDPTVIADAIKLVSGALGAPAAPSLSVQQAQAAAKAKAGSIKPPLPAGGVAAPVTKDRKLTEEERLEAAFKAIQQK